MLHRLTPFLLTFAAPLRSWSRCRRAILFVSPAHHDPERIVRQWPLQRLGLMVAY